MATWPWKTIVSTVVISAVFVVLTIAYGNHLGY